MLTLKNHRLLFKGQDLVLLKDFFESILADFLKDFLEDLLEDFDQALRS